MTNFFCKCSLLLLTIIITGCSHTPRSVNADIPLVETVSIISDELVPEHLWRILSDETQSQFDHQDYSISMSSIYDSALGAKCRLLTFLHDEQISGSRTSCSITSNQNQDEWFLMETISNEHIAVNLQ